MEPNATQQEVLLITDTAFAHRPWAERNGDGQARLSAIEQLEKACWDGLLREMMPELGTEMNPATKLWLWQVHRTSAFLALDFCEFPEPKDNGSSIDPRVFMLVHNDN